jgi:hypothetical protein
LKAAGIRVFGDRPRNRLRIPDPEFQRLLIDQPLDRLIGDAPGIELGAGATATAAAASAILAAT